MSFLRTFYRSLFDTAWLREQRLFTGRAWGYAIFLTAVLAVLQLLPVVRLFPGIFAHIEGGVQSVPEFTAHIKDGVLRVEGLPQPYQKTVLTNGGQFQIFVDTVSTTTPTAMQIASSSAIAMLVTARELTLSDGLSGQVQTQTFAGIADETFSKQDLINVTSKLTRLGAPVLSVLFVVMFAVVLLVGRGLHLLVVAALVYWFTRARRAEWTFGQVFTVGLFALTLPGLIAAIEFWLGWPIPLLYTFVLILLLVLTIRTPASPVGSEGAPITSTRANSVVKD